MTSKLLNTMKELASVLIKDDELFHLVISEGVSVLHCQFQLGAYSVTESERQKNNNVVASDAQSNERIWIECEHGTLAVLELHRLIDGEWSVESRISWPIEFDATYHKRKIAAGALIDAYAHYVALSPKDQKLVENMVEKLKLDEFKRIMKKSPAIL